MADAMFMPPPAKKRPMREVWADIGQIMTVMGADPRYTTLAAGDLLTMILPPVTMGHFAIAKAPTKLVGRDHSIPAPRAAILWARVSDEVDARLRAAREIPKLEAWEWNSGPNHWIVHTPGDQGAISPLLSQLQKEVPKGTRFTAVIPAGDEGLKLVELRSRLGDGLHRPSTRDWVPEAHPA